MKRIINYIKNDFFENWKTKNYGFYVSLGGFLCLFLSLILYPSVPNVCFNPSVIALSIVGLVLYLVFIQFKETGILSSVTIMVFSFLCLMAFANADGLLDYLSTAFFAGFSLKALFALPTPLILSVLFMVIGFLAGSVSMYMPMNKKNMKLNGEEN